MAFYALVLEQNFGYWREFLLLSIPTFSILVLHNIKDFFINFWRSDKGENSGYKLETKFLPTAANTVAESWRFLSNPKKKFQIKRQHWRVESNWKWWICCIAGGSQLRATHDPDLFNFENTAKSRMKYRERFLLTLGESVII